MPVKATLKASLTSVFPFDKGTTNKKDRRFSGISWKSSSSQSSSNDSVTPKNHDAELVGQHHGHGTGAHTCPTSTGSCAYNSSPILGSDTIGNKMSLSRSCSHSFHQTSSSRASVSVPSLTPFSLPEESALATLSQVVQDGHFPGIISLDSSHPLPPTTNCTFNLHCRKNQDRHDRWHYDNDCAADSKVGCHNECQSKHGPRCSCALPYLIADRHNMLADPWATYELVQRSTPKVIQTLPGSDHTTIKSMLAGGRTGWRMWHAVV